MMDLEEDWNTIVKRIKKTYPERKIEEEEDMVEIRLRPRKFLMIDRQGKVEGAMPRHHFQSEGVERVLVENGITRVIGDGFSYMFKT
ncbi:MAG: hypothetical protein ABEJ93_00815 [Candidatus Nanohalobium sp.]